MRGRLAGGYHEREAGGRRRARRQAARSTIPYAGKLREVTYAGWPLHTYKFAYSAQSSVINIGIKQFGGPWYALAPAGHDHQVRVRSESQGFKEREHESGLEVLSCGRGECLCCVWRMLAGSAAAKVLRVGTYKGIARPVHDDPGGGQRRQARRLDPVGPGDYKTSSYQAPKGHADVPAGDPARQAATCSCAA